MAGPSSEAGHVNTETAETSSHPEIEPEIKVAKATGDSDEVCETGATEEPKPPASKCTDKGISEAAKDSDWYCALRDRDCKVLMSLLRADPCLVAQMGPEGWTVVHAAAERGCFELLDQVFKLFQDSQNKMSITNLFSLLFAKCGPFKAEAQNMAWFTLPRQAWRAIHRHPYTSTVNPGDFRPSSGSSQLQRNKLIEIMQGPEPSELWKRGLERGYQSDANYNFVLEREELHFHYACGELFTQFMKLPWSDRTAERYVEAVIRGCQKLGPDESVKVLTYLFQLRNAQGQTPFHVASLSESMEYLLELVPPGNEYKKCLNATDVRGWTILHYVTATKNHRDLEILLEDGREVLLKDGRVDANAQTSISEEVMGDEDQTKIPDYDRKGGMTALHLAILHNDLESVKLLLKCLDTDVNALLYRHILCGHEKTRAGDDTSKRKQTRYWTPLQLATIMGLSDIVRALLGSTHKDKIKDYESLTYHNRIEKAFPKVSTLLLACASGDPDILQLFIDSPMELDPLVKFEEATALHYATNATMPTAEEDKLEHSRVGYILYFSDLGKLDRDTSYKNEEETKVIESYLGRKACTTMLLQYGVDIWERDDRKRLADPGPEAPKEALLWWHEQMVRETLEAKQSLNNAANAISVVVALVATASFVGPLQPPLGYGGDSVEGGIQDIHLSVRVFMVSNILSFYFAVAAIMFAVVPSLPMPQEGIHPELQRTRRSVGVAMFFLLLSVLGVLISFGTASNSVVSKDYSWQHAGLSFYPTLLGGFICILGIILFFIRLLRLVFYKNSNIRYLYKAFIKF